MNEYLPYIGILGFVLLCALQVKLWCNLYYTCGVMWTGLKNWFKKDTITEDQRIDLGLVKDDD